MPRHSFIQMTKLHNVMGRIDYITSTVKQENLYAIYATQPLRSFWKDLAKCNREEFAKSGTIGKYIEARELIIALPEGLYHYEHDYLIKHFATDFKKKYGVDCYAALHHNKRKTNFHIHLIFAERTKLEKPVVKVASRNMFYDERGKHVRRGILKNEKYKGDLLMGKTYTVDPISKRRLDNHGESNKYYTKNHHEAIISEEEWDKVQDILKSRYRANENVSDAERIKFARKYAFSSMCQCGFCGTNLTRRSHNQDTKHKKPVWKCRTATNKGIANCPHSKAVDEVVIENAFLEMFNLLAENFDDVLESVLSSVEETLSKDDSTEKLKRIEKEISSLEKKRKKLTDMYLDDKISKEAYDDKYSEISNKLDKCEEEKHLFSDCVLSQKNIADKMKLIRQKLKGADVLDEFDRVVFESIVEKVVVGDMEEDGTADPYKLTFVLKGMDDRSIPYARDRYMNLCEKAV